MCGGFLGNKTPITVIATGNYVIKDKEKTRRMVRQHPNRRADPRWPLSAIHIFFFKFTIYRSDAAPRRRVNGESCPWC